MKNPNGPSREDVEAMQDQLSDNDLPNDIWKDPSVVAALKDGRPPDDVMVMACPKCNRYGYYNQGSNFWCRFCKEGWYCCSEGEESPTDRQWLDLNMESPITLADTITDPTDGYHNETQNG